ncbi:MAG: DegQ family serine endoprotease [Bdellovibrionales bacterium]|nr:DegQ family serine endoprotease [Bdellovibrionales bacterium]
MRYSKKTSVFILGFLISGLLLTFQALMLQGCDKFPGFEKKSSSSDEPWETEAPRPQAENTVPWNNQAIATNSFIKIAKTADPGVVNIGTTQVIKGGPKGFRGSPFEDFFGDDLFRHFFGENDAQEEPEVKRPSLGSGFILTEDGLIVTNNHVVEKASEITVTIGKDTEYKATVVGTDPKTDVALIKINPKEKLHPLQLGDSDALEVGEIVVAIGNPFGLSHTVTQGIVSAKERTTIGAGPYDNFIQTDASINPGNSGGPLLNLDAKVVGINTAIVAGGQGIGFAIPINLAKSIVKQLQEKGSVTRGWLGVYIQKIDPEIAKSLNLKNRQGALVADIQKNSPAEKAGFKQGDVIIEVEGKQIRDSNELPLFIANQPVGKKVTVTVIRNGKTIKLHPVLGKLQSSKEEEARASSKKPDGEEEPSFDKLGLITTKPKDTKKGVRVISMDSSSPAAEKGIRRGDLILEVNQKEVTDKTTYDNLLKELKKGDSVLLLIETTEGGSRFIAFSL